MGVYIKNIKMPDSCINCPFSVSVNFGLVCCPTSTTIPDSKLFNDVGEPLDRQGYCPLTELPPHGRLIDTDSTVEVELYDDEHEEWKTKFMSVETYLGYCYNEVPTIIEGEGT